MKREIIDNAGKVKQRITELKREITQLTSRCDELQTHREQLSTTLEQARSKAQQHQSKMPGTKAKDETFAQWQHQKLQLEQTVYTIQEQLTKSLRAKIRIQEQIQQREHELTILEQQYAEWAKWTRDAAIKKQMQDEQERLNSQLTEEANNIIKQLLQPIESENDLKTVYATVERIEQLSPELKSKLDQISAQYTRARISNNDIASFSDCNEK